MDVPESINRQGCGAWYGEDGAGVTTEALSHQELRRQNDVHAGTGGLSANNRLEGFRPAFRHTGTGRVVISCFADGNPAPLHVLDGLPEDWVAERDAHGQVCRTVPAVEAGFERGGRFFSREAAAEWIARGADNGASGG